MTWYWCRSSFCVRSPDQLSVLAWCHFPRHPRCHQRQSAGPSPLDVVSLLPWNKPTFAKLLERDLNADSRAVFLCWLTVNKDRINNWWLIWDLWLPVQHLWCTIECQGAAYPLPSKWSAVSVNLVGFMTAPLSKRSAQWEDWFFFGGDWYLKCHLDNNVVPQQGLSVWLPWRWASPCWALPTVSWDTVAIYEQPPVVWASENCHLS